MSWVLRHAEGRLQVYCDRGHSLRRLGPKVQILAWGKTAPLLERLRAALDDRGFSYEVREY